MTTTAPTGYGSRDGVGEAEWAWAVAGLPTEYDAALTAPETVLVPGRPPLLLLPAAWAADPALRECGHAQAIVRLCLSRGGRLLLLRRVTHYLAAGAAAGLAALTLLLDANGDGIGNLASWVLRLCGA